MNSSRNLRYAAGKNTVYKILFAKSSNFYFDFLFSIHAARILSFHSFLAWSFCERSSAIRLIRFELTGNRVAEGEIFLLRSADGVFLAGMADADGGMIGGHGIVLIMVYVIVELKYRRPGY